MNLFKRNNTRFMVVGMPSKPKPNKPRTQPEYVCGIFKTEKSAQKYIDNMKCRPPHMEIIKIIFEK